MNSDPQTTPDELRDIELTAYALNELDPDRRADLETRLAGDPQLREQLANMQAQAQAVEAAFAVEPLPATGPTPPLRSPWVHRGVGLAACLGLAAGTAWVLGPAMGPADTPPRVANSKGQDVTLARKESRANPTASVATRAPSAAPVDAPAPAAPDLSTALNRAAYADSDGDEISHSTWRGVPLKGDNSAAFFTEVPSAQNTGRLGDQEGRGQELAQVRGFAAMAAAQRPAANEPLGVSVWNQRNAGDWRGGVIRNDNSTAFETDAVSPTQTRFGFEAVKDERPDAFFAEPARQPIHHQAENAETYANLTDNPFRSPADAPLSTFSIDVDTASYANVRRMLTAGQLPPADAVRIEEFVNSFDYAYAPPATDADAPFATHVAVASAPWAPQHRLIRIGLKGKKIATDDRPAANLVFLLDVSGSMKSAKKLPLVKDGLRKLVAALRMDDRIAIVVYAGASGLVLDSTSDHDAVLAAIDNLSPGGSTHGSAGIELAYDVATANFIDGGLNRVILCTDGDFNVGITDRSTLKTLIEEKAATGTYLSILGFGAGNLKDATMEELSNAGDGNYGYIDSPKEAEKLLARQVNGTLLTIAKDVKIQVEFNPAKVASYRLIGYANRMLAKEDFNNDKVDAGDIGSGHTVTALYEVVPMGVAGPVGVAGPTPAVDPLKYSAPAATPAAAGHDSDELLTVKLRYKAPDAPKEQGTSQLLTVPVVDADQGLDDADADFQFAAAAAGLGMVLRDSDHAGDLDLAQVAQLARGANARFQGADQERAAREAFVELVERAAAISAEPDDQRP